jgi:hypothetical protein
MTRSGCTTRQVTMNEYGGWRTALNNALGRQRDQRLDLVATDRHGKTVSFELCLAPSPWRKARGHDSPGDIRAFAGRRRAEGIPAQSFVSGLRLASDLMPRHPGFFLALAAGQQPSRWTAIWNLTKMVDRRFGMCGPTCWGSRQHYLSDIELYRDCERAARDKHRPTRSRRKAGQGPVIRSGRAGGGRCLLTFNVLIPI